MFDLVVGIRQKSRDRNFENTFQILDINQVHLPFLFRDFESLFYERVGAAAVQ